MAYGDSDYIDILRDDISKLESLLREIYSYRGNAVNGTTSIPSVVMDKIEKLLEVKK